MSRRTKKPAKPGPFRPAQKQPLHVTLERELRFSHAAALAAAQQVILTVGYHRDSRPNELSIYLPANGLTVTLVYDSAETVAQLPPPRIALPPIGIGGAL